MSEDIKKTINELHIYEKKVLKELEANPNATPEEIAENVLSSEFLGREKVVVLLHDSSTRTTTPKALGS